VPGFRATHAGAGRPETQEQSFADFLVRHPPDAVRTKLRAGRDGRGGAVRPRHRPARLFAEPPAPESLSMEFLRSYHRYADAIFETYRSLVKCVSLTSRCLVSGVRSGEYSRMLEEN